MYILPERSVIMDVPAFCFLCFCVRSEFMENVLHIGLKMPGFIMHLTLKMLIFARNKF